MGSNKMNMTHYFRKYKNQAVGLVLIAVSQFGLSGCIQGKSYASTQFDSIEQVEVTDALLRSVNASFHNTFVGGDWYYQGAEEVKGEIYAYIQIPKRMQLSSSQQKHYLQKAICPNAKNTELWDELENVPLSVHVYTINKRYTVYAQCNNPFA